MRKLPEDLQCVVCLEWLTTVDVIHVLMSIVCGSPWTPVRGFRDWIGEVTRRLQGWEYLVRAFKTEMKWEELRKVLTGYFAEFQNWRLSVYDEYQCYQGLGICKNAMTVLDPCAMKTLTALALHAKHVTWRTNFPCPSLRTMFPNAVSVLIQHTPCAIRGELIDAEHIRAVSICDEHSTSSVYDKYRTPLRAETVPNLEAINICRYHPLIGVFPKVRHIAGWLTELANHVPMDQVESVFIHTEDIPSIVFAPQVRTLRLAGCLTSAVSFARLFAQFPNIRTLDVKMLFLGCDPPSQYPATLKEIVMYEKVTPFSTYIAWQQLTLKLKHAI